MTYWDGLLNGILLGALLVAVPLYIYGHLQIKKGIRRMEGHIAAVDKIIEKMRPPAG